MLWSHPLILWNSTFIPTPCSDHTHWRSEYSHQHHALIIPTDALNIHTNTMLWSHPLTLWIFTPTPCSDHTHWRSEYPHQHHALITLTLWIFTPTPCSDHTHWRSEYSHQHHALITPTDALNIHTNTMLWSYPLTLWIFTPTPCSDHTHWRSEYSHQHHALITLTLWIFTPTPCSDHTHWRSEYSHQHHPLMLWSRPLMLWTFIPMHPDEEYVTQYEATLQRKKTSWAGVYLSLDATRGECIQELQVLTFGAFHLVVIEVVPVGGRADKSFESERFTMTVAWGVNQRETQNSICTCTCFEVWGCAAIKNIY